MTCEISSKPAFDHATAQPKLAAKSKRKKRPAPLSIRVNDEERAKLEEQAGGGSVHGYVRDVLFGPCASPSKRVRRAKTLDHEALARVLGALGQSRLSSNMNQIAKAAHFGALPVSPELQQELYTACADIHGMRQDLIAAIGLRP